MKSTLVSFFSPYISPEFCVHRTLSNIKIATYLCYGIVILSTLLLFNDYTRYTSGKWIESPAMEYITYSHIGYLLVALGFLIWKIFFQEKAKPRHRNYAVMGLVNGILFFCITITIAAQHMHGQVTMYVLGIVVVAFLIVQSPKEMLITFINMWILTIAGLNLFGNPTLFGATAINLSSVVFVSLIIAYYLFKVQMSSFTQSTLIEQQRIQLEKSKEELEQKIQRRTQDLIEANKGLKQAKAELHSLVYHSSHDLRGPMTSILGLVQVIQYDDIHPYTQKYLNMIELCVGKMDRVMKEINHLAAIAQYEVKYDSVKIEQLIKQVIEETPHSDDIFFMLHIPRDMTIICDSERLDMIFHHLIRNVIDYRDTKKEKSICEIKITQLDGLAHIEVLDNGIGIPENYLPQITHMFFRTEKASGSGLGLYIVEQTLSSLKGKLSIHSIEHEFTSVKFTIPHSNEPA